MGTVEQLSQLGFDANQAKHLAINGISIGDSGWIPATIVTANNDVIDVSNQAVYLSASAFDIPGDITALIQTGDKVRWDQPTLGRKYGYIATASYAGGVTTVSIIINTDYTVANEAITDLMFSRVSLPMSFPKRFNYSPTVTGFGVGAAPASAINQFYISDLTCFVSIRQPNMGTSNSVGFLITSPIAATTQTNGVWGVVWWQAFDNGAQLAPPGRAYITSASSTITIETTTAAGAWTNVNGKAVSFTNLAYPI